MTRTRHTAYPTRDGNRLTWRGGQEHLDYPTTEAAAEALALLRLQGPFFDSSDIAQWLKLIWHEQAAAKLREDLGVPTPAEILKDWAEHVQKNRRRWEGRKYDADDWYDEALAFAEEYWKFHNLDPWDDIPQRDVEDYAEDNAPDMLEHVNAPGGGGLQPECATVEVLHGLR